MNRQLVRALVAATALAGLSTVAACGGGSPADPAPTDAAVTRTTGPLDEFFGAPSAELTDEEMAAQERKVQESVVACMAAEGFEYRPFIMTQPVETAYDNFGTRAFAEKYGYGISTFATGSPSVEAGPTSAPTDPNQAIVDAMSDAEREAYYAALYGAPVMASESGAAEPTASIAPPGPEDLGCFGTAQQEVYGGGTASPDQFNDLFERMSAIYEKVADDPAVAQAQADWTACMADAGHPGLASVDDPMQQISERMNAFWSDMDGASPAPLVTETATATAAPDSMGPDPDDPALIQLKADEIAMAVADFDCRASSGYQAAFDAVSQDLQEQFVRDNRAELERYRDAMNGGG